MRIEHIIKVTWWFFWHGRNYCSEEAKDMTAAKALIRSIREEGEKTRLRPEGIRAERVTVHYFEGATVKEAA